MATVTGQLQSSAINGKPRDLMDIIFDISPSDTPFLTMCGKSKATQTLHEWQTDSLLAPGDNAVLEGADVTSFKETTTTELSNKTQILTTAIQVSATAQAVEQKGVSKQYSYQMARRMKELKKDLELALLSNNIEAAESGSTPRRMRGLPCWISSAHAKLNGPSAAAATSTTPCVAGTTRLPDEATVKDLLTTLYTDGANPDRIMMAPSIRVKMSEVLGYGHTKMEKVETKKVTSTVDVYVSDFGSIKLVPNRVQAYETYSAKCAFFLDPDYWKVAYLRGFKEEQLAHTGDNLKGHIVVECTLEARNPESSGMIADLNNA